MVDVPFLCDFADFDLILLPCVETIIDWGDPITIPNIISCLREEALYSISAHYAVK